MCSAQFFSPWVFISQYVSALLCQTSLEGDLQCWLSSVVVEFLAAAIFVFCSTETPRRFQQNLLSISVSYILSLSMSLNVSSPHKTYF
jgi:hypothetical protein